MVWPPFFIVFALFVGSYAKECQLRKGIHKNNAHHCEDLNCHPVFCQREGSIEQIGATQRVTTTGSKCRLRPGVHINNSHFCETPNCNLVFCEFEPVVASQQSIETSAGKASCVPKEGKEAWADFCNRPDCATTYSFYCESSIEKSTDLSSSSSVDCATLAEEGGPYDSDLSAHCKTSLLETKCEQAKVTCDNDVTCVENELQKFCEMFGGSYGESSTSTKPPGSSSSSSSSSSTTSSGLSSLSTSASSTSASSTSTSSGDCPSLGPDDPTPFEIAFRPVDVALASRWGVNNYQGKHSYEAAEQIHADVAQAVREGPCEFRKFCGSGDLEKDRRECAAFFANMAAETGGFGAFVEVSPAGNYCTWTEEGDEGMQAAGKDYPCCVEEDMTTLCSDEASCPFACKFIGRGGIQLTWNVNYGRFSEFYFGDRYKLLRNPDLVQGPDPLGWAASMWFWMTAQDYGGNCPPPSYEDELPVGRQSCHDAMQLDDGGGFGQTVRIINGGYEACPTSSYRSSPLYRIENYLRILGNLGVPAKAGCDPYDGGCDVSGYEFFASSGGTIGNPLIGTATASDCPDCSVETCSYTETESWNFCGPASPSGVDDCPNPTPLKMYTCS